MTSFEFVMIGDKNILKSRITTPQIDKVFILYKGCIIQVSKNYAKENYKTREFKTNVINFINDKIVNMIGNNKLSEKDYDIILQNNVDKIEIVG